MLLSAFRSAILLSAASTAHLTSAASPIARPSTPTCTTPTGLANNFVPAPQSMGFSFKPSADFVAAHSLFEIDSLPESFSEASILTYCLEQCVVHQGKPCLSFFVNLGNPVPPKPAGPTQYYCMGFDTPVVYDGSSFVENNVTGSYLYPISVNRVCNGTYRAY